MMPFLSGFIFLLGLIHFSSQSEDKLKSASMATDWESAQNSCINDNRILMSEMPSSTSLANVKTGDAIWVNAKVTWIEYANIGTTEYLKLAFLASETFLENCICVSKSVGDSGMTTCTRTKTAVNWTEANKMCTFNGNTWDPLPSHRFKNAVAMMDKDSVSMCVCLQRLEGGSFKERLDNCSNSHSYLCAEDRDMYAPTLTRLITPIPELSINSDVTGENKNSQGSSDSGSSDSGGSKTLIGAIAGGVAGCIVIVIAAVGAFFVCRRYQRRRQYRHSLRRFSNKQTIRSANTLPKASDLDKGRSMTLDSSVVQGKLRYEDCTGKKYATLQGEVARECKGRLNRQGYVNEIGPNVNSIEDLESYEEFSPSHKKLDSLEPDQEVYENTRLKKASVHVDEKESEGDDGYVESGKAMVTKKTSGARQQPVQAKPDGNVATNTGRAKLNYDVPPRREKGRFGLKFGTAAGNKQRAIVGELLQQQRGGQEDAQSQRGQEDAPSQNATLLELDNYENFDTLGRNQRAVKDLNELETYENSAKQHKHF